MRDKTYHQSDYMALQLMEIEKFRMTLTQRGQEQVSFQEAAMLWITEGYAEAFKSTYNLAKDKIEPALA